MKPYGFQTCRILPVPRRVPENWKKHPTHPSRPGLDLGQFVHLHTLFEPMDGWRIQVIGMRHQTIGQLHHGNGERSYLQWEKEVSNLWYTPGVTGVTGCGWKWTLHWPNCLMIWCWLRVCRSQVVAFIHGRWMTSLCRWQHLQSRNATSTISHDGMRSCSNGWWLQEQRLDQSTMLLEKLWRFTCGELWRATLCIDWHDMIHVLIWRSCIHREKQSISVVQ